MGGGIPLNRANVSDLEKDLRHLIDELQSAYPQQTIHSDIAISGTIFCDRERIAQLFSNLLTNALVHGAQDQPVDVTAQIRDDIFTLSVANSGTPISQEAMVRLFQPYWRGAERNPQGGLGLGLYIAAEIAHSHHGKLNVVSGDNKTEFTFTLPLNTNGN
jgi:signal transduction histidine kinase